MAFGKYLGLLGGLGGGVATGAIPPKYLGVLGGLGGMGASGMIDPEMLKYLMGGMGAGMGRKGGMFGAGMPQTGMFPGMFGGG